MKTDLNQSIKRIAWIHAVGISTITAVAFCLTTSTARAAEPPKPKQPAAAKDAGSAVLGAKLDEFDGKLQVVRVDTGGPADRAGLRRGDIVLSIGREQIAGYQDVTTALGRHRPQDKVAVVVERDGTTRTLQAILGDSRAADATSKRDVAVPNQAAGADATPDASTAPDFSAEAPGPIVVDGQDIGKTAEGITQMLRGMTQGLRRSEPAGAAPTGRPRRPLLDRLSGAAPAAEQAAPKAGDVQVDLGQESGSSATEDLADRPAGPGGQAAKARAATADKAAPPRRAVGTRPRPRLDRLRDRLGKAAGGAEAPAYEGGALQPASPLVEEPTPRVAGRQPLPESGRRPVPEELPRPEPSQNRRASDQQPVDKDEADRPTAPKPALGVTLKLRDAGVVVSAVTPGGAAEAAGLKVGDILTRIDGRKVTSVREATDYIATQNSGDEVELQIQREGRQRLLKATLGTRPVAR